MVTDDTEAETAELLEQYKFYAQTTSDVSDRRLETNRFYVSLLSGILVVSPFTLGLDDFTTISLLLLFAIGFVGTVVAVVWFFNILSYKQLNSGKFEVIHEMEDALPYPCFQREWKRLEEGRQVSTYLTHWRVERLVPMLVAIPYIGLMVFALVQLS